MDYDCVLMNIKLQVGTLGMVINKLSLIWSISHYTGLAVIY